MPIKFNKSFKRLTALTFADKAKDKYARFVKKFIKDEIIASLNRGVSPVIKGGLDPEGSSGKLRFQGYSDSYKKEISRGRYEGKTQRPVNLKLSGKLHRSIKTRIIKAGTVKVWFTDSKAKYHNKLGAGKSKVLRRLVPDGKNETFNARIQRKIVDALKNAIKLSI